MWWLDTINCVLRKIEAYLTWDADAPDPLNAEDLAQSAHLSAFTLQRAFALCTGMTLSEYIRARRLSVAAQELQTTGAKVLDVALRYGYETPESFQKAFRRFHGVTPTYAKRANTRLQYLNPLQIHIEIKGGTIMDYQLESIGELTVIGKAWSLTFEEAFTSVPKLWNDYYAQGCHKLVPGYIGMCDDDVSKTTGKFTYIIGCFADPDKDVVPEGYIKRTLKPHTWAKFRSVGPMPGAIQACNRRIYNEWLPNNPNYKLASGCNLEIYTEGDMSASDYTAEIWIPVLPVQNAD